MPLNSQTQSTRTTTRRAHRRPRHQRRARNKLPQNKYGVIIPSATTYNSQCNSLVANNHSKKGGGGGPFVDSSATNRRSSSQSRHGGNKPSKKGFGVARSIMQPPSRKNSAATAANNSSRHAPNTAVNTNGGNEGAPLLTNTVHGPRHHLHQHGGPPPPPPPPRRSTKMALVLQRLSALGCVDVDRTVVRDVFNSLGGNVDKTIEFFLPADTERKEPQPQPPPKILSPLSPTMMSPLRHSPLTYPMMYMSSSPIGATAAAGARVFSRSSPTNPQDMSVGDVNDDGLPSFSLGPAHRPTTGFARGSGSHSLLREPQSPRVRATDPFWTIPADVTLEIFEFFQNAGLATISKVSRDARLLVREALSTVSILKFHKYSGWSDQRILSMIQCHRNLDALSLRKCGWFTSFARLPDAVFPSTVAKLDVSSCYELCDRHVCAMATGFPRLVTLDVSHTEISDVAIEHIWSNCVQLADLRLQGCDYITDHGVRSLLTRCSTLTSLNVRKTEITAAAFEDHFGWRSAVQINNTPVQRSRASSITVAAAAAASHTAATTDLSSGTRSPAVGAIDISATSTPPPVPVPSPSQSLSTTTNSNGTDSHSHSSSSSALRRRRSQRRNSSKFGRRASLSREVRAHGFSLATLDTRDCRRIAELIFVSPLCNLTSLNMSFSPSLLRAHMAVPMLTNLNISSSKNVKSLALRLPLLETLNLSQCTSLRHFEEPTECPLLRSANLNQCRSLSRCSLMALCASSSSTSSTATSSSTKTTHSLRELSLVGMLALSDDDVTKIVSTCGNLSSFDFAGCRNISVRTRRFVERRVLANDVEQRRQRAATTTHDGDELAPLDLSDPSSWDFSFLGPEEEEDDIELPRC